MVQILRKLTLLLMLLPLAAAAQQLPITFGGSGAGTAAQALANFLGNPTPGTYSVNCSTTTSCAPTAGGSGLPASVAVLGTNGSGAAIGATAAQIASVFSCSTGQYLAAGGGCSSSSAATQWGWDAVRDAGMSASATDNSSALSTFLNSTAATILPLVIPCASTPYKFTNGVTINATNTAQGRITLWGGGWSPWAGTGCAIFEYTGTAHPDLLWWDNSTSTDNNGGFYIHGLTLEDGSSSGVHSLVRVTNFNFFKIENSSVQLASGSELTGTCTVANESTSFSCTGMTITSAMVGGQLWVANTGPTIGGTAQSEFQEINSTSTFTIPWQGSGTTASAAMDYNGFGIDIEGNGNYSQYCTIQDVGGSGDRVFLNFAGSNSSSTGTSRCRVIGGYFAGNRSVPGTIFVNAQQFDDTPQVNADANNVAVCINIEGAHSAYIGNAHCENTSASGTPHFPIVTTCASGTGTQNCLKDVVVRGWSAHPIHDFTMEGTYLVRTGVGVEFEGNPPHVTNVRISGLQFQDASGSSSSNIQNYYFPGGAGCQRQKIATVEDDDCTAFNNWGNVYSFGGVETIIGTGTPSGTCSTGDTWKNTSGGVGSTLYGCAGSTWHNIL